MTLILHPMLVVHTDCLFCSEIRVREMFLSFVGHFVRQTMGFEGFAEHFICGGKNLIEIKANRFLLCSMFALFDKKSSFKTSSHM